MVKLGPYDDRPLEHMQLEARVKELEAEVRRLRKALRAMSDYDVELVALDERFADWYVKNYSTPKATP